MNEVEQQVLKIALEALEKIAANEPTVRQERSVVSRVVDGPGHMSMLMGEMITKPNSDDVRKFLNYLYARQALEAIKALKEQK